MKESTHEDLGRDTHVFIVRVWCEPRETPGASRQWRGVIEHVSTRESCYVDDLDELVAFISRYLCAMGVSFGIRSRLKRWLRRWT
jgi:hypothetical protein